MNTEYLKTFLTLAKNKSFSQTAKECMMAQSTVSNRIRELENDIGQKLFLRGHMNTELTEAGKAFLEYAERIINLAAKGIEEANLNSEFTEKITLGTVYAFYDDYLSFILEQFIRVNPHISVKVLFGHSGKVLSDCRKDTADLVFSHHSFEHQDFESILIKKDDMVLVTGANNKEYEKGVLVENIKELPMIYSNFLYADTHQWLFGKHQQFQLELEISAKVIPFLQKGKWYSLLARELIKEKLESGEFVEIPILNAKIPPVEYYMVYRKSSKSIIIHKMIEIINDYFRK